MKFNCPRCFREYEKEITDKIGYSCDNCECKFEVSANGVSRSLEWLKARWTAFVGGSSGGICAGCGMRGEVF